MADVTTDAPAVPADAASAAAPTANAPASQSAAPATPPTDSSTAAPANGQPEAGKEASTDGAAKPGDKPADAPAIPEKYEFKLPEDIKLEGAALEELSGLAKELGLTQEQAQKVADLGAKQAQTLASQYVEQHKTTVNEWATQTKTDKEIGGEALEANLGAAKKALDQFGSPELKKLLNESGLGNHPEVVRMFVKAGKAISEDGRLVTGAARQSDRESKPIENRIYPNQT